MKGLAIALAALAAFLVTVPARATVKEELEVFINLDDNRDGYVSIDEVREHRSINTRLERFDGDGNGKLDLDEFVALVQNHGDAGGIEKKQN